MSIAVSLSTLGYGCSRSTATALSTIGYVCAEFPSVAFTWAFARLVASELRARIQAEQPQAMLDADGLLAVLERTDG